VVVDVGHDRMAYSVVMVVDGNPRANGPEISQA
jgi:hypothetical protein